MGRGGRRLEGVGRRLEGASGRWQAHKQGGWQEEIPGVEEEVAEVKRGPHSHVSPFQGLFCVTHDPFSRVWAGIWGLDSPLPSPEVWPSPWAGEEAPQPQRTPGPTTQGKSGGSRQVTGWEDRGQRRRLPLAVGGPGARPADARFQGPGTLVLQTKLLPPWGRREGRGPGKAAGAVSPLPW